MAKTVKTSSKKTSSKKTSSKKTSSKKTSSKKTDVDEISFSSLDHVLTPPHEKLSEEEVDHVIQTYNLNKAQLPKISLSDPAIKHLDVNSGDVVKITRSSPTSGETYYYRMVINS